MSTQKIADEYKAETGVTLKVVTAASGTYEQTLKSEIAKSDAPVLFQINGPVGYAAWKDYTADLSGTELYKHLSDKTMAVTDGSWRLWHTVCGRRLRDHLQQCHHDQVFRVGRRQSNLHGPRSTILRRSRPLWKT